MSRILITGASSYLGQYLTPLAAVQADVLSTFMTAADAIEVGAKQPLDIRDGAAVSALVRAWQPTAIIHLAGSNRSPDMEAVITQGAAHIRDAAAAVGARLISVSTDVIFDGTAAPYAETAPPRPVHAYGRAKVAAEAVIAAYADHVIVRTSLIYGLSRMDMGTRWIARALAHGDPVTLFDNQWRNPVWARSLSQALLELTKHDYSGILNVAGRQVMTRAEYHQKLLDWWDVQGRTQVTIGPDATGRFPLDCCLDISLATSLLQTPLLGFDEVVAQAA